MEELNIGLERHETADGLAGVAIVVAGRVNAARVEVQDVRVAATLGGRGPVIAVAAGVVQGAGSDVPTNQKARRSQRSSFCDKVDRGRR